MKQTTQYDYESYHIITTDPRGIVQSISITRDAAHDLVAKGYTMKPDRIHFSGFLQQHRKPIYNKLGKVIEMPFDKWEGMQANLLEQTNQAQWDYHKGKWLIPSGDRKYLHNLENYYKTIDLGYGFS